MLYSVFFYTLNRVEGRKFEIDKFAKTLLIGLIIHLIALILQADPYSLSTVSIEAVFIVCIDKVVNKLGVPKIESSEILRVVRVIAVAAGMDPTAIGKLTLEQLIEKLVARLRRS